jgi:hypothetical protein
MALAVAFGWAFALPDWRIGQALGVSENAVRLMRRELGLRKTGGGMPVWRDT